MIEYKPEDVNLRGIYRKYDKNGNVSTYYTGDVVDFENKKYIATDVIVGIQPKTIGSAWKEFEISSRFYYSILEPQNTNEGDRWLDRQSGRLFTRVLDESGLIWVEL
jgi:hypothetical protein